MMDYYLTNPNIEGVYESCVPSEFKAIVDLGSTSRMVDRNNPIMEIDNLQRVEQVFDY